MRLSRAFVASMLVQMGQLHSDAVDSDVRNDAGETAVFARQLEYIIAEIYRVEYPELRARDFIPINSRVPSGANSFTWRLWDWAGMAKLVESHADDIPTVEILAAELPQAIRSLAIGYTYGLQDIRAAQMAGIPLETEKADAAKRGHENKLELLAAFGDTGTGLPGFLNNSNIPLLSAPGDINGAWLNPTTDPRDILTDLHTFANSVHKTTKGTHAADTLLLDLVTFDFLSTKQLTQFTETTILQAFLKSNAYIKNVDQWNQLTLANAGLNGPRAMVYKRNNRVVELVIPQEFEQLPPQVVNLGFKVPCHSRIGGVTWRYPLAAAYLDSFT